MAAALAKARILAVTMQQRIKTERGLTATIGIASNKFLAKIAGDHQKPDGLALREPHSAAGERVNVGRIVKLAARNTHVLNAVINHKLNRILGLPTVPARTIPGSRINPPHRKYRSCCIGE